MQRAIEIVFILFLLIVLAAIFAPNIIGRVDKSQIQKVKNDIVDLSIAVDAYEAREGHYPNRLSGILEGTDQDAPLLDPWGNSYNYSTDKPSVAPEGLPYYIWSMGRDERSGGEGIDQDRGNW